MIFVLSGLDSAAARAQEAESVVNWAFRQFTQRDLGEAGTRIAEAPVALGTTQSVGLELKDDLSMLVPVTGGDEIEAEVIYTGPFQAPISKGDELGELVVDRGELPAMRVPLVASASIAPGGFMVKMTAAALHLMNRLNAGPQAAPTVEAETS